jgi:hypothetical protein
MTPTKYLWRCIAIFAWIWQYFVYMPAYIAINVSIWLVWLLAGWPYADPPTFHIEMRPWLLSRIRGGSADRLPTSR